jgi:ATP-dependent DNA ligase
MAEVPFYGIQRAADYDGFPKGYDYLIAEPKFDGFRFFGVVKDEDVTIYCRDPKPVMWAANLDHIKTELLELGFDNCIVDGEIMARDWNKTGIIKRGCGSKGYTRPNDETMAEIAREVKLHAFDWIDLAQVRFVENERKKMAPCFAMPLWERKAELRKYLQGAELTDIVRPVPHEEVTSEAETQDAFERALAAGYEGLVIKVPLSVYSFVETKAWRKYKPVDTIELQIVEVFEGNEGKTGRLLGKMGTCRCVNKDGTEIFVGGGYSDVDRAKVWAERDQYVGKIMEVEVTRSEVATARHPTFKRWRDDRASL